MAHVLPAAYEPVHTFGVVDRAIRRIVLNSRTMNDLTDPQKHALKAFKKRIKINQQEDDSRLGRSPLTGSHTKVMAIRPPPGFPPEVWEELATLGFLKRDSGGFYEIIPGK